MSLRLLGACAHTRIQLFAVLQTAARQAPLAWSGLPFPFPRGPSDLRIEPASLLFPALAGGFFTTAPPGKPLPSFLVHLINIMVPGSQINLILLMS